MHDASNHRIVCAAAGLALAFAAATASAGVVDGTHEPLVRVCFVGDAITKKPEDVAFVWQHLKTFENHGNIRFVMMENGGRCPPPRLSSDGRFDINDGDLRIGIPGTLDYDGKTPITGLRLGRGCADPGATPWWSNFPGNKDKPEFRACRLTTFVRKEMRLNKILHELGHAVGMYHEHERTDVPMSDPKVATCFRDVKYFGKSIAPGAPGITHVTPYDRDSVMHYEINHRIDPTNVPAASTCNLGNDNGNTGLSTLDQLSIRIMYPHDRRVAEARGPRIVAVGDLVTFRNEWGALGGLVAHTVKNPAWLVSHGNTRVVEQNSPDFAFRFTLPGSYAVRYRFNDARGRDYVSSFTLQVLAPERLRGHHGALTAARAALF